MDLAEGDNTITVEVTAEDTTTMMTYTVTVTRAALVNICDRTPEVEAWILSSLPSGIDCAAVTEEQLAEIQDYLEIDEYSSASIVPEDFAGLTGLPSVRIRQSPALTTIPANAFSQIPNLARLDLRNNNISSVHEDAFNGLTALSFLELRFNSLTTLDADIFDGLTALRSVYLGSNSLTTLDADIFDGLTALWLLDLSHNSLTTLDADIFDGLTALAHLDLADNGLTTLDADIFDGLAALTRLGLYENDLTTLDADIFDGLTALSSLSLQENSFTTLDADIFDGLTALSVLYLRDNILTTLPDGIFNDQTALGELYIQCNSLTELDLSRFDPVAGTLYYLDIRNNYFATPPSETAIREKLTSLSPTGLLTGDGAPCTPRVTVLPSLLTVAEGNSTTYTVALRTQPTGDVMVTISSDNTEVTVSPTTPLTFTATTWNTAQTVTVSAAQDADTVDDVVTLTHVPSGANYDSVSNTPLTLTIEDDDVPASTDASLGSLSLSSGTLSPAFTPFTTSYTARVESSVSSTTVTAQPTHASATRVIKLGGVTDTDGTVDLAVGNNIITVEVTAEDTVATRTYQVMVTRATDTAQPGVEPRESERGRGGQRHLHGEAGHAAQRERDRHGLLRRHRSGHGIPRKPDIHDDQLEHDTDGDRQRRGRLGHRQREPHGDGDRVGRRLRRQEGHSQRHRDGRRHGADQARRAPESQRDGRRPDADRPRLERPLHRRQLRHNRLQDRGLHRRRLQLVRPRCQHRQRQPHLLPYRPLRRDHPPLPRLRHQRRRDRQPLKRRQ